MKTNKKKVIRMVTRRRLCYDLNDDVLLLREVVFNNPFQDDTKWITVATNLNEMTNKCFKVRSIKEHVQHLMNLFKQDDRKNLKKSGSEEQYIEKERLLQNVMDLRNERVKNKPILVNGNNKTQDELKMEQCAETGLADPLLIYINSDIETVVDLEPEVLTPDSHESTEQSSSKISRPAKKQCLQSNCLETRNEEYILLEKKKFELELKKYELEQEKFKLEKEERTKRLEMEMKEREEAIKDKQHNRKILDELLKIILKEQN